MTSKEFKKEGSRRSSLFSMARKSFIRSDGERGASVAVMRGTHGSDFECKATVQRGAAHSGCYNCLYGFGGNAKSECFILLKGPFCFVYKTAQSKSPQYAISLVDMKTEQRDCVVALQTSLGDTDFEMTFDDAEVAKRFCKKVHSLADHGKADEIRKNLGHEHLLHKTKSIMFAENIALKKLEDQPSAPFANDEIIATAGMNPM